MRDDDSVLLVRAADAGRTYVTWRWLDADPRPGYLTVDPQVLGHAHAETRGLLTPPRSTDPRKLTARRLLRSGAFADPAAETRLSRTLGAALLPPEVWARLVRTADSGRLSTVRITPSRALARIPWELLVAPGDGRRLLEVARIVYDAPAAAVHYHRPRLPAQAAGADRPLRTLEPALPPEARLLLPEVLPWASRVHLRPSLGLSPEECAARTMSRGDLHRALVADPAPTRWLYVGHVSADDDAPGSASLHLSDDATWHSSTTKLADHRPFSARDLHMGTADVTDRLPGVTYPSPMALEGAQIWPMPPRVAILACSSGGDHAAVETFGLVIAALAAGAEHVTSTRWLIPTDRAFHTADPELSRLFPTSDLIVAVDRAHADPGADPVDALRSWQLDRLARWVETGDIAFTPVLAAGVTTHHAPPRPDQRLTEHGDS